MSIAIRNLAVRYGRRLALSDVDADVARGEILGIVGPNGSGKSSLVRAVAGMVPFTGRTITPASDRIGYMPQDNAVRASLSVLEVVVLGRLRQLGLRIGEDDLARAIAALDELGIAHLASRRIDEISGGQRQMTMLAQVLAAEPAALLLDEPVSALDPRHQFEVLRTIRVIARTRMIPTIVVLHDLNAALRHCDRLLVLRGGVPIAHGAAPEILTAALLADVFGIEAEFGTARDGTSFVVPLRVSGLQPDPGRGPAASLGGGGAPLLDPIRNSRA